MGNAWRIPFGALIGIRPRLARTWPGPTADRPLLVQVAGIDLGFEYQVGPHVLVAGTVGMQEECSLQGVVKTFHTMQIGHDFTSRWIGDQGRPVHTVRLALRFEDEVQPLARGLVEARPIEVAGQPSIRLVAPGPRLETRWGRAQRDGVAIELQPHVLALARPVGSIKRVPMPTDIQRPTRTSPSSRLL